MGSPPAIDRIRMRRIPSQWEESPWRWTAPDGRKGSAAGTKAGAALLAIAAAAIVLRDPEPPSPVADPAPIWLEAPPPAQSGGGAARPRPRGADAASHTSASTPGPARIPTEETTILPVPAPALAADEPIGGTAGGAPGSGRAPESARGSAAEGGDPGSATGSLVLGSAPAAIRAAVPRYPQRAERLGLEATVVVLVATDTAGNVVEVRVERSGGPDFDESARRAAFATRYAAPVRDGRPRPAAFRIPYEFRLD